MSVDLNKGATVELVKTLSDDLRTKADGTKASSAGEAVRGQFSDLKSAIDVLSPKWEAGGIASATGEEASAGDITEPNSETLQAIKDSFEQPDEGTRYESVDEFITEVLEEIRF